MCPAEWWLIYESKRSRDASADYAGSLTDNLCSELLDMLE